MKKVAIFTGTRAEYGLLYWLIHDVHLDPEMELGLVVSGSHLSPEFGATYKQIEADGFPISEKVEILLSSDSSIGTCKSAGLAMIGFADTFSRLKPDVLIILGDRYEALAAAQVAMILRIPVVHLHGGEITEGAYDDAFRHCITKLSYLHCTANDAYRQRVIQLGESPERVYNVGAIGLDHLKRTSLMSLAELSRSLNFELVQPYFVVTYHPVTLANEKPVNAFSELLTALDRFPEHKIILTYPNADDGGRQIIPLLESFASSRSDRVLAIPSLGQRRYLSAIKYAEAVIGNSSSGIIEVPAFDIPTINIGMRQKGRLAAESVLHCSPEANAIVGAIKLGIGRGYKRAGEQIQNPYGQGDVSSKVIALIKSLNFDAIKPFYDVKGMENHDADHC